MNFLGHSIRFAWSSYWWFSHQTSGAEIEQVLAYSTRFPCQCNLLLLHSSQRPAHGMISSTCWHAKLNRFYGKHNLYVQIIKNFTYSKLVVMVHIRIHDCYNCRERKYLYFS